MNEKGGLADIPSGKVSEPWTAEPRDIVTVGGRGSAASTTVASRVDLTGGDWNRVVQLVEEYADLGLGTVDASIIAVAERLEIGVIATLNRRDFLIVRPSHVDALELVP